MLNFFLSEREILINQWRSRIGIERAKKEESTGVVAGDHGSRTSLSGWPQRQPLPQPWLSARHR
jgi:hypothetical protein